MSRYSWHAPPTHKILAMQDKYVAAQHNSCLPTGYPESFIPEVWSRPFTERSLTDFKGPIIALADCISRAPKGPLKFLADQFKCVSDLFALRTPAFEGASFCNMKDASVLGTFRKLDTIESGPSPSIYLIFNTMYTLSESNREAELQSIR